MPRPRSLVELRRYREQRKKAIEKLGGKCVRCGFDDWRALQFDHVNGGGNRGGARGRVHYLRRLIDAVNGELQLLCANCNCIKRYECGEGVVITDKVGGNVNAGKIN